MRLTRHLPVMAMVTAVIVLVFGSLTLVLHDDTFIKMKADHHLRAVRRASSRRAVVHKSLLAVVFELGVRPERGRLAQAHLALGGLLSRARRAQRDRLAHPDDRFLGELQGVRRAALTFIFAALQ